MEWDRHKLLCDGTDNYVPWTILTMLIDVATCTWNFFTQDGGTGQNFKYRVTFCYIRRKKAVELAPSHNYKILIYGSCWRRVFEGY